jgi:hypothetical protein
MRPIGERETSGRLSLRAIRLWTGASLLIIVPLGFCTKFYSGPAANWVNNSLGGVFYEVFWCLLIFLFLDAGKPRVIAIWVLILTCCLEFLQLFHPPFLELLRGTFIGRTILGTSFTWSDFLYYFLGCGVGWLWMRWLRGADKH